MNKEKIKRIIAREGLIILFLMGVGIFCLFKTTYWVLGIFMLMLAYPLYLIMRFITWAFRTLELNQKLKNFFDILLKILSKPVVFLFAVLIALIFLLVISVILYENKPHENKPHTGAELMAQTKKGREILERKGIEYKN